MQGFKQKTRLFKRAFLAGRINADEHLRGGQYGR
jgi:hypothetical protein